MLTVRSAHFRGLVVEQGNSPRHNLYRHLGGSLLQKDQLPLSFFNLQYVLSPFGDFFVIYSDMRHIKTFSLFESTQNLTPEQVEFLDEYTDGTWSFNPTTGLVDVEGDFDCSLEELKNFKGVKFGRVSGTFNCSLNSLTTLEGAPETVRGNFHCNSNSLRNLEGAPKTVGGDFRCFRNLLRSLKGGPKTVGGYFSCSRNPLLWSLEGAPQVVGGDFASDVVDIPKGLWTVPNLVQIYLDSPEESKSKDLLGTLVSPEALQERIDKNPEEAAVFLKGSIKDLLELPEYQSLKFPQRLQQEVDLLGDLSGVGL